MFGTFKGPSYSPYAMGDSAVDYKIGMRGYDGGIHNSPFADGGRVKEPFSAPGPYNPFMFMRPRRRRINLLSVIQVMAVPFLVFATTMYLFGFSLHHNSPTWCWFFVAFCVVLSLLFLVKGYLVYRTQKHERWSVPWYLLNDDDTWFLYLGASILFSCLLGYLVGQIIFTDHTHDYYILSSLHTYKDVDPISLGKAYLDAAAIEFKNDTFVDTSYAVGYKDGSVYCTAPVKLGKDPVVGHDFWAVGKDCCTGFPGNFNCFENRNDNAAHGGLRVINDEEISFYKLAVMQANGEFKKDAEYLKDGRLDSVKPLFFTWMRDPVGRIESYWTDAVWIYKTALVVFFVVQSLTVFLMANKYWKERLWG